MQSVSLSHRHQSTKPEPRTAEASRKPAPKKESDDDEGRRARFDVWHYKGIKKEEYFLSIKKGLANILQVNQSIFYFTRRFGVLAHVPAASVLFTPLDI